MQAVYKSNHPYFFVYQKNDPLHFSLQLLMASNWGIADLSFNGPIWSVSVEVLVYFLFFVTMRFTSRPILVTICLLAASIGTRICHVSDAITECLSFFFLGGLCAVIAQHFDATGGRRLSNIVVGAMLVFTCAVLAAFKLYKWKYFDYFSYYEMWCAGCFLYIASEDFKLPAIARRFIEAAGNMTYSSYLLHFPLQLAIVIAFSALGCKIHGYSRAFFIFYLSITFLLSYLTYRHLERPAQIRLRRLGFVAGRLSR